ncbi:hypothetical protein ACX0HA_16730 [Flavobacterium hauense]
MKKIAEQSLEELTGLESRLKGILWGYIIIGVFMIVVLLYLQTTNPLSYLPLGILPVVGGSLVFGLKSVQGEIAKRKEKNNINAS